MSRRRQCSDCGRWVPAGQVHRGLCDDCRADADERAYVLERAQRRAAEPLRAPTFRRHGNPFNLLGGTAGTNDPGNAIDEAQP